MKKLTCFVYAILAGVAISIGGIVFLACENKYFGCVMFSIGLYAVCTLGLNLFTGKVCYVLDNPPGYILDVVIIWLGNLVGSLAMGLLVRNTRLLDTVCQTAVNVANVKLGDGLLSVFLLAILCNIMIYLGVENFKKNPHEVGKYVGVVMAVAVFVICGFEHCVANMFYFSAAGAWSLRTVGYLLVMTAGNTVGGLIFPLAQKLKDKYE